MKTKPKYGSYRIRREELKQKRRILRILSFFLHILEFLVVRYG